MTASRNASMAAATVLFALKTDDPATSRLVGFEMSPGDRPLIDVLFEGAAVQQVASNIVDRETLTFVMKR
jgi:hypothetical protein